MYKSDHEKERGKQQRRRLPSALMFSIRMPWSFINFMAALIFSISSYLFFAGSCVLSVMASPDTASSRLQRARVRSGPSVKESMVGNPLCDKRWFTQLRKASCWRYTQVASLRRIIDFPGCIFVLAFKKGSFEGEYCIFLKRREQNSPQLIYSTAMSLHMFGTRRGGRGLRKIDGYVSSFQFSLVGALLVRSVLLDSLLLFSYRLWLPTWWANGQKAKQTQHRKRRKKKKKKKKKEKKKREEIFLLFAHSESRKKQPHRTVTLKWISISMHRTEYGI